jgi:hypothetical protein
MARIRRREGPPTSLDAGEGADAGGNSFGYQDSCASNDYSLPSPATEEARCML